MSGWQITDNFIQGTTLGFLLGGGRRNKVLRNRLSGVATGIWLLPSGITTEKSDCQQILGKRVKELLVRSGSIEFCTAALLSSGCSLQYKSLLIQLTACRMSTVSRLSVGKAVPGTQEYHDRSRVCSNRLRYFRQHLRQWSVHVSGLKG